ncbi:MULTISPECIES: sugar transferase [unclassified Prochlorococcus]|uniref:sugar transferase n=1 Tax=unclassified Prochlorococcus TaxID=2627481 RepID=UPI00097CC8D7|nr:MULTISPECIES: sugar transferase [unclassified Prochlorococcus]AQL29774.1 exopolysaccharide biosynthesis protein [Prochlorococcus sp. RS50]AQL31595.1 exopolysaccharide biosynthesis protein [Prochlorococcus sp. RS01]AQL34547.1 exopolysaccharide biosynthesis protein [Prochlorococcus sp. RS04]
MFYKIFKRFCDFVFSLLLIIFLIPFFLLIAILIKMDSKGAIFYIQKRIGKNNKTFSCYKFRTMKPESKYLLKKILIKNPNFKNEFKNTRKIKNDPRITNIGKFLRFSSLDELPQIINVLKGEMSFIGPRPIVKSEIKKYGNNFEKAFLIKPGISGLWQVSGRNNLSYEKRIELDIFYSKNTSFLLDIKIFIKTLKVLILPFGKGGF